MHPAVDPVSKEQHERNAKLLGGLHCLRCAVLVATFAKSDDYPRAWVVISLLALSLPSLVACMLLDFIVRVAQTRKKSAFRGLAFGLGFGPSLLGIAILIGHFSVVASVLLIAVRV